MQIQFSKKSNTAKIDFRASLPYPTDRIWMGWSKYANGEWVANNLYIPLLSHWLPWGSDEMKNKDYAISIRTVENYKMVTTIVNETANVICQQNNNSKLTF